MTTSPADVPPAPSGAADTPAEQGTRRDSLRDLIEAAIDRQKPLPETRRAAAVIAETSVRAVDDAGTAGYVIFGPDGQPRMAMRGGTSVPFTLDDLAADVRQKHPSLFDGEAPDDEAVAAPAAAPVRDWLRVGSESDDANVALEAAPSAKGLDQLISAERRRSPRDWFAQLSSWNVKPLRERWARVASAAAQKSSDAVTHLVSRGMRVRDRLRADDSRLSAPRSKFRARHLVYAGAGVALLMVLAVLIPGARRDAPAERAPAPVARSETAAATGSVAAAPPTAADAKRSGTFTGVPEIVDTATLRLDGNVVRLFGVEWARGAQPEDLARYIAGRAVVCTAATRPDRHRCQVDGHDLSEAVLYNGGGRATADATPEMKEAEAHARAERLGVWQKP